MRAACVRGPGVGCAGGLTFASQAAMTADSRDPRDTSRAPAAPLPPAADTSTPSLLPVLRPDTSPEDDARTPAEYTEPPGSHRRPSDGAALDVGG